MPTDDSRLDVLIVEDEPGLAELYAAWLSDTHDVTVTNDGEAALDRLDASVDIVLLDRRMPGFSGDDVLDHIRRESVDTQVIIISAVVPDFDIIGMQFDAYLTKPVDIDDIHAAIETVRSHADLSEAEKVYHRLRVAKETLEAAKRRTELEASAAYDTLLNRLGEQKERFEE